MWVIQFAFPASRHAMIYVYGAWLAFEVLKAPFRKNEKNAFLIFARLTRERVFPSKR